LAAAGSDTVQFNTAGGGCSTAGQGYGGGVYLQSGATASLDGTTVARTIHNHADIDPDIDGTYTLQSC
jgi:hypothetical protein